MFFKKKTQQKPVVVKKPKEEILFKIDEKPEIPQIPEFQDKTQINVRYPLIPPYAYAHIYWDSRSHELIYNVEEPPLDKDEEKTLELIREGIKELINISFISVKDTKKIISYLEKNIKILLKEFGIKITKRTFLKVIYYIYRDFVGLNEIEPLMNDYYIEDIECNGSQTPLYIVHRKYRNIKTNIKFEDNQILASFVEKLAQKCGKYVSYANPLLDGRLPDNSRVNATYTEDVTSRGPTFTIRKFTKEPWTPIHLMEFNTVSPEVLAYLWLLIEHESSLLIVGSTGSGKTSFLNAISFFIPPQARIVSIEDTKELMLPHENWLPSVARAGVGMADIMGRTHGEVDLFTLLRESFRQRPDYVIVGEVRGREAYVLFQGIASGHPSFGTMHAESIETVIRRLETPPINLSPALVNSLDAICVVVHAKVKNKGVRRLKEIVEVLKAKEQIGQIESNKPFVWDPRTDKFFFKTKSHVFRKIAAKKGLSLQQLDMEFKLRIRLLMEMYKRKINSPKDVGEILALYYKNPQLVLKRFGIIR